MRSRHYQRFEDFWPDYVAAHRHSLNRKLHFWGTNNLFFWLALSILRRSPKFFVFAIVSSYACAWFGHFFIEKNRPSTLDYPILSALGDLQMYIRSWQGKMDAEVAQYVEER